MLRDGSLIQTVSRKPLSAPRQADKAYVEKELSVMVVTAHNA